MCLLSIKELIVRIGVYLIHVCKHCEIKLRKDEFSYIDIVRGKQNIFYGVKVFPRIPDSIRQGNMSCKLPDIGIRDLFYSGRESTKDLP